MDKTKVNGLSQLSDWLDHWIKIYPVDLHSTFPINIKFQESDPLLSYALQRYIFTDKFKSWLTQYNVKVTEKRQLRFPNEHVKTLFKLVWSS